jgi:hypothetical protein
MKHTRTAAAVLALALVASCGPARTPTAETSRTPRPPNLVDYGKEGIELRSGRDVHKLKGAPDDFKQYMAGLADATGFDADPDDECVPRVYVDKIEPRGYASGAEISCGGAAIIWARRDGIWREIWSGQITPDCPTMKKYSVPTSIVGDRCYDVEAQDDVPYG